MCCVKSVNRCTGWCNKNTQCDVIFTQTHAIAHCVTPRNELLHTPPKTRQQNQSVKNRPFSCSIGPPWGCHCDMTELRNRLVHIDKEWALATASPCRPQTFPAGTLLVPLSSASPRRIDPLRGRCPPLPPAAAPLSGLPSGAFEKSFSFRPRRGKEQRGVAGDLLANRSTLPQPPRGRNACYGVLSEGLRGRKRFVPGTPKAWQAGTPFLIGAVSLSLGWAIRARKPLFWRLMVWELSPTPVACAAGQI